MEELLAYTRQSNSDYIPPCRQFRPWANHWLRVLQFTVNNLELQRQRRPYLFYSFPERAQLFGVLALYAQRPIVDEHKRIALYHPSAEAISSMIIDLPYKLLNAFAFNTPVYLLANLKRDTGAFFFSIFVSFSLTLAMSMLFRTVASLTRTLEQTLPPTTVFVLGVIIYTGFLIYPTYVVNWAQWIEYVNPIAYGFESLMANE